MGFLTTIVRALDLTNPVFNAGTLGCGPSPPFMKHLERLDE